jgi:hypothetical protein
MVRPSLSTLQSTVALTAGLLSIAGAVYPTLHQLSPAAHPSPFTARVAEAGTDRPLAGATIDVLTPANEVVGSLTSRADGFAECSLPQGSYHLRTSLPQFDATTVDIRLPDVGPAPVRIALTPRSAASARSARSAAPHPASPRRTADRAVSVTQSFLHRLGL